MSISPELQYALVIASSALVSLLSIPKIIYVAHHKHLFDVPDNHRKLHSRVVPNLGGIAIFFSYVLVATLFINIGDLKWNYIVAASMILFIIGVKDDLVTISPAKKFAAQFIAALIMAYFANIRLTNFYGLFGLHHLPKWFSIGFTIVGTMFVTNAYNLIDGIDGLAASIGVLSSLLMGLFLAFAGHTSEAVIAFSLMGALLGFLYYNVSPAKIFMGDTGSMLIGFTLALVGILFINSVPVASMLLHFGCNPSAKLIIALSLLFIPIFDTFRVFTTRIIKGRSPFSADRTHLHHYLLDLGLSHGQTVTILITANILIITVCGFVQHFNIHLAIMTLFFVAFGLFGVVFFLRKAKYASKSEEIFTDGSHNGTLHSAGSGSQGEHQDSGPHITVRGHRLHMEVNSEVAEI